MSDTESDNEEYETWEEQYNHMKKHDIALSKWTKYCLEINDGEYIVKFKMDFMNRRISDINFYKYCNSSNNISNS